MAEIIDGKTFAAGLRERVAKQVRALTSQHGIAPGLAVILVGENSASQVYVRNKVETTQKVGMESLQHRCDASISEEDLLNLLRQLNKDDAVNGILVQLPLPEHIDEGKVLATIDPDKDVDGFNPVSVGRLWAGMKGLVPCTPLGCNMLLKNNHDDLSGKHAVVVGCSNIVGKPMAALLLRENCTVEIAHARTVDLPTTVGRADILVSAAGCPEMIVGDWLKPGVTVIDVGINRIEQPDGETRLVGDVDFESAEKVAGAITPVPGGVGPMTVACLLSNTTKAACMQRGIPVPQV